VLITARDNAQTAPLALERWPEAEVIGGQSPRAKPAKVRAIGRRIVDLRRWAARTRPDVALSHNSYAQIVAARARRMPVVTTMDFEHQPANHLAFRLADTVVVPEVLPIGALKRHGARPSKVIRYPGLKEELYVGDFEPDATILQKVGLAARPRTVVVLRTPPSRAVYHPAGNPLFDAVLRSLTAHDETVCLALTRHPEQVAAIERLRLGNCIVPREAIDSRSLIYAADAMIGAGGTMTREAALMGIPTWTLFAGQVPAVDRWLEGQRLLTRLADASQLAELGPRRAEPRTPAELRVRGAAIERILVDATLAAKTERARREPILAGA
jgi:predicted glycosyltransferase